MNKNTDTKLYHDIGQIKGILSGVDKHLIGIDKRLSHIEQNQNEMHKKVIRNTTICSGVMSVAVSYIVTQIKGTMGLGG